MCAIWIQGLSSTPTSITFSLILLTSNFNPFKSFMQPLLSNFEFSGYPWCQTGYCCPNKGLYIQTWYWLSLPPNKEGNTLSLQPFRPLAILAFEQAGMCPCNQTHQSTECKIRCPLNQTEQTSLNIYCFSET